MSLDITPYLTVAEADVYFAAILDVEAWEDADDPDQLKALKMATIKIDSLNYIDDPITADHAFPRTHQDAVPDNVLRAVCEIALAILDGQDYDSIYGDQRVVSDAYDSVKTTYNKDFFEIHRLLGLPRKAFNYLQPWLSYGSTQLNLERIT